MPKKLRKKRMHYSKTQPTKTLVARRSSLVFFSLILIVALLFAVGHGLSYFGSFLFSNNPSFTLRTFEISTDGRLPVPELKRWAGIGFETNLFAIDFKEVRQNLLSQPQIESVSIRRNLPSTLQIQVKERDAVAQIRFRRSGFLYFLDRHGIAMRPPPACQSDQRILPLIVGIKAKEPRLGEQIPDLGVLFVLELLSLTDTLGLSSQIRFEKFNLSYSDFIRVSLNDGISASFPRHSAREKLIRLVRVLQIAEEQGRHVKIVDLTPDGRNVPTIYK